MNKYNYIELVALQNCQSKNVYQKTVAHNFTPENVRVISRISVGDYDIIQYTKTTD